MIKSLLIKVFLCLFFLSLTNVSTAKVNFLSFNISNARTISNIFLDTVQNKKSNFLSINPSLSLFFKGKKDISYYLKLGHNLYYNVRKNDYKFTTNNQLDYKNRKYKEVFGGFGMYDFLVYKKYLFILTSGLDFNFGYQFKDKDSITLYDSNNVYLTTQENRKYPKELRLALNTSLMIQHKLIKNVYCGFSFSCSYFLRSKFGESYFESYNWQNNNLTYYRERIQFKRDIYTDFDLNAGIHLVYKYN